MKTKCDYAVFSSKYQSTLYMNNGQNIQQSSSEIDDELIAF